VVDLKKEKCNGKCNARPDPGTNKGARRNAESMSWLSSFSFSREPDPQCVALQASLKSVLSRIEAAERSLVLIAETDVEMPESRRSLVRSTYGDKEERLRRAQEVITAGAGKSRADHTSSMRLHLSDLVESLSAVEQTLQPLVGGRPAGDTPEALLERLALQAAAAVRSIYRDSEEARSTKSPEEVEELITKYTATLAPNPNPNPNPKPKPNP